MLKSKRNWLALSVSILGLSACGTSGQLSDGIEVHKDAIQKVALTYGAQSGLSWEATRINDQLAHFSRELDAIYDFNFLMMYRNVLPPVIEESYLSYNIANTKEVRLADKEIRIIRQAKFVSMAPTWHDYIDITYDKPKAPPLAVMPQNKEELEVWEAAIQKGWEQGVQQARENFSTALRHLNRDFIGMTTFYALYAQNMVSSPVTTATNLGVTGDENSMRIGDQVLRITALAKLNTKYSNTWNPALDQNIDQNKKPGKIRKGKYRK